MLYAIAMIVITLIIIIAAAPIVVCAADNPLRVTVTQVFTTSKSSAEGVFTYMLKPLEPHNPMPAGSTAKGYTFTISGNNSVEINLPGFIRQGVYRYELYQKIDAEKPGYTYDKRVYIIEAHVDAMLEAMIVVFNANDEKTDRIVFENSCQVLPTDPKLMVDPPVKKTVFGSPSRNSTFTFRLAAQDASWPMPEGSANGVKTLRITGSGQGEFGVWSYDKTGTYYYTVYEVNGGESRYTYDTAVYTITDMVTEENGQLVLSRVVTNNTNKQVTSLAFNNRYRQGGSEGGGDKPGNPDGGNPGNPGGGSPGKPGGGNSGGGNPSVDIPDDGAPGHGVTGTTGDTGNTGVTGVTGPKTGDDMNTDFYIALFALGCILAVGAMLYLAADKKDKKARRLIIEE